MQAIRASQPEWRFSTRILQTVLAVGAAAMLLAASVLVLAAHESDRIAAERESSLVSRVLSEQAAKISHDQESVTVWDDAVKNTKITFDRGWTDINLGTWMHDYFGHDRLFVLDAGDEPIYACVDGKDAEPSTFSPDREAVLPLARKLRALLEGTEPGAAAADPAKFRAADLVTVEGHPAVASVMPIVSDSGALPQAPGTDYLHVSIRFLDGDFLDDLMHTYLLTGTRFSWTNDAALGETAFPLKASTGKVLGYFIWEPQRPGDRLLKRTAPAFGAVLVAVAAIVALLTRRLRRASRELEASEAHAQHLAFHDPLTGLPNRALFADRLDRALAQARGSGRGLALLYLDVDRFKTVNDTLGHPAGDALIRELGRRLTSLVRAPDDVARLGGDEFAIIQSDVTGPADAEALCRRIIRAVEPPFQLPGMSAFVGISIGVAIGTEPGCERADLVRKADIALYRAKLEGGNQSRIFTPDMDVTLQRRREVERELRDAIATGDQLDVLFQPLVAPESGAVVAVEALLRWTHPVQGPISPSAFIPIAEETGLIDALGAWVLRRAVAAARRWPDYRIAVNVSAVQFRSPDFAAQVLDILREAGLAPGRLELEVTEGVLLDSAELSTTALTTLRAAGVRIALDDFGTGFSSLTYLQRFPVDRIKIDRSFVHTLDSGAASDAIVRAMVDLARALGVEVTAEGVETEAQRDILRRIGCDELQGYLFSPPIGMHEIDRLHECGQGASRPPRDARTTARIAAA